MHNYELLFNSAEQEIRRKWLAWVIKFPTFLLIVAALTEMLELLLNLDQFTVIDFYNKAGLSTLSACLLYIYYSCAYKTPDTNWLSFFLCLTPIRIFIFLMSIKTIKSDLNLYAIVFLVTTFCLIFIYEVRVFYLSLKLKKINQTFQHKILLSSKKYLRDLTSILSALTLLELNENYKILIENNRSLQFRMHITKAYEEKKQSFS